MNQTYYYHYSFYYDYGIIMLIIIIVIVIFPHIALTIMHTITITRSLFFCSHLGPWVGLEKHRPNDVWVQLPDWKGLKSKGPQARTFDAFKPCCTCLSARPSRSSKMQRGQPLQQI